MSIDILVYVSYFKGSLAPGSVVGVSRGPRLPAGFTSAGLIYRLNDSRGTMRLLLRRKLCRNSFLRAGKFDQVERVACGFPHPIH